MSTKPTCTITDLPVELLLEIGENCSRQSLLSLMSASRKLSTVLNLLLYQEVFFVGEKQMKAFQSHFSNGREQQVLFLATDISPLTESLHQIRLQEDNLQLAVSMQMEDLKTTSKQVNPHNDRVVSVSTWHEDLRRRARKLTIDAEHISLPATDEGRGFWDAWNQHIPGTPGQQNSRTLKLAIQSSMPDISDVTLKMVGVARLPWKLIGASGAEKKLIINTIIG